MASIQAEVAQVIRQEVQNLRNAMQEQQREAEEQAQNGAHVGHGRHEVFNVKRIQAERTALDTEMFHLFKSYTK